jgi:hypothetical protein
MSVITGAGGKILIPGERSIMAAPFLGLIWAAFPWGSAWVYGKKGCNLMAAVNCSR